MSKSYPSKDENNILSRALDEAVDTMCFVCRGRKCSECEFDRDYFINKVKEHDEMHERVEEISKHRDWVDLDKTLAQIKNEYIEGKASTVNPLDLIELLADLQIRRKVSQEFEQIHAVREFARRELSGGMNNDT